MRSSLSAVVETPSLVASETEEKGRIGKGASHTAKLRASPARNRRQPLTQKHSTLQPRKRVPNTPEIRLATRHPIDPKPHRDTQRVDSIKQRRDDTVTPPHVRAARQRGGHQLRVARLEAAVGPDVEVDAHVGEPEERAGGEGDGPALVVGVEA